jgi:hypothetical protein
LSGPAVAARGLVCQFGPCGRRTTSASRWLCDRVGLLLDGRLRAIGRPRELEAALGPEATLEDVFRAYAADGSDEDKGGLRAVRSFRTAGRLR